MTNRFNLPYLGFGLGLRYPHYQHILHTRPKVGWFEIISENFIDAHKGHWEFLAELNKTYPIVMHGVSLSIGGIDPLNRDYLNKLKTLAEFLKTPWVSDHLCWTGIAHRNTHDLLPVPYTEDALSHIVDRIKQVQDILGRPLVIENPSSYVAFKDSTMSEWEFIARMSEGADCGLLLDVNNIFVSAFNHRFDAKAYIDALPGDRVVQIHLAGHTNNKTHIIDTHDDFVTDDVWKLYEYTINKLGPVTTMVEWDDKIPEFDVLLGEFERAQAITNALKVAS